MDTDRTDAPHPYLPTSITPRRKSSQRPPDALAGGTGRWGILRRKCTLARPRMNDLSYSEAKELVSQPRLCEDAPAWVHSTMVRGLSTMECGLIEADGSYGGFQVVLAVSRSPTTKLRAFKFTLFRLRFGARERVYQLHLSAVNHKPQNQHDQLHERIGDRREYSPAAWLNEDFEQILARFCAGISVTFVPPITDPEAFELKS
jgi:hypothetical protein